MHVACNRSGGRSGITILAQALLHATCSLLFDHFVTLGIFIEVAMVAGTSFEQLIPADTSALQSLQDVLEFVKLKEEDWNTLVAELGEDELTDFRDVALLDNESWRTAAQSLRPLAKARANLAVNVVRHLVGMAMSDFNVKDVAEAGVVAIPEAPAGVVTKPCEAPLEESTLLFGDGRQVVTAGTGILLREVWDQWSNRLVKPAGPEDLANARTNWVSYDGSEPDWGEEVTDKQLSVLIRLTEDDSNLLAWDMAILGPKSFRRERNFNLLRPKLTSSGGLLDETVPGPASSADWEAAWKFATRLFAHWPKSVSPLRMRNYAKRFLWRATLAGPANWWLCVEADWTIRFEIAPVARRKLEHWHETMPGWSTFNPDAPWDSVLAFLTDGKEADDIWERQLKDRITLQQDNRLYLEWSSSWEAKQAALGGPLRDPSTTGRALASTAAALQRSPAQPPQQRLSKTQQRKQRKAPLLFQDGNPKRARAAPMREDGRLFSCNGKPICYAFSRNRNGCVPDDQIASATCANGRCHCCEFCGDDNSGRHRTIDCPANPNWIPPQPVAKGRGKGRGKGSKK